MAKCMDAAAGSIFTSSQWTNITPEVPMEVESTPALDDPVAHGPRRAIARPADHHAAGRRPSVAAAVALSFRSPVPTRSTGQQIASRSSAFSSSSTRAAGHVQEQRAAGIAHVGGELTGQPAADLVLGQQHLAGLVEVPRLVVAQPEIFGAVKPVRAGLATSSMSFARPPARCFDLAALGRGALIVPENSPANHFAFWSRNTEPCIWPDSPMACTSAAFSRALSHDRPHRP